MSEQTEKEREVKLVKKLEKVKRDLRRAILDEYTNTARSIFAYKFKDLDAYSQKLLSDEIERLLFEQGRCTVFKDVDGVWKCYGVGGTIQFGDYQNPLQWGGVSRMGNAVSGITTANGVIIENNKTITPTRVFIEHLVERMINTELTIDQQLNAMKTPFIFSGIEEDMLAFKIMYQQLTEGYGAFYLDKTGIKNTDGTPFKVWNSDINYKADKLMDLYDKYENRILKRLGLQSNYIEKKAQQNTDEVNKNDDIVLVNFESFKSSRQFAVDILKSIGLNCELVINEYLVKQNGKEKESGSSGGSDK